MKTNPIFSLMAIAALCNLILSPNLSAQNNVMRRGDDLEKVLAFWSSRMEMARVEVNADKQEFAQFNRFFQKQIDSIHVAYIKTANNLATAEKTAIELMDKNEKYVVSLYKQYNKIKNEFPSSVNEYRTERRPRLGGDSCFSACNNTDFESGTLNGWYGYYGVNSSAAYFNITGVTGGYCGPVTKAAGPDAATNNTYQLHVTSSTQTDYFLSTYASISFPQVSPYGGNHSVMLGDSLMNLYGAAILSQSFLVTPTNDNLTLQYAVFLERNPSHTFYIQPYFEILIMDSSGDTIPICGNYSVSASSPGLNKTYYPAGGDSVTWSPWTMVSVPLAHKIGQCITVIFEDWDCAAGGHFGYAYVDASCSPLEISSSSPNFCGQDSICMTAPPGFIRYQWFDSARGLLIADTFQTACTDSAGTYYVVLTPATGAACTDTISITIGRAPGPPPHPSFSTSRVCSGESMYFNNTSNPLVGATFDWDFYNIGYYNDSNVTNPNWTYVSPGFYYVKLHEVYNGCGKDTIEKVEVDSTVDGSFAAPNVCIGNATNFTYTGAGATSWSWNFGDPSTLADTSNVPNPSYTYTMTGTFTVTLISRNGGSCPDTVKQVVRVDNIPVITGLDSICPGYSDTLTVTGGSSYVWINGATTSTIVINPTVTRTITVTADGACTASFVVYAVPISARISAPYDTICAGASLTLCASGGTTYHWSNGSSLSCVTVSPTVKTTYTAYVSMGTCVDSVTFVVNVIPLPAGHVYASKDSICVGDEDTLCATGGTSYFWSNGSTSFCIIVSPSVTTVYTVTLRNGMCSDSLTQKVVVNPCTIGIPGIQNSQQFQIFPNPSNGMITVQMTTFSGLWSVKVYDVLGQEVFSKSYQPIANSCQLDLSSKADGVYFYRILKEDGSSIGDGKFVIER